MKANGTGSGRGGGLPVPGCFYSRKYSAEPEKARKEGGWRSHAGVWSEAFASAKLLFTGNIPRGVFVSEAKRKSQKTRGSWREIMRNA